MFEMMVDPVTPGPWAEGGDVRSQPLSSYARDRLPVVGAVLSARPLQLNGCELVELLAQTGSCVAQLDYARCQAISALVLRDFGSPSVLRAQRPGVRGGPVLRRLGGDGTPVCSEFLATEVALVLSCSPAEATRWIALAVDLRFRLRHTSHHFGGGRISLAHARVIAELTRSLDDDVLEGIDEKLAEAALTRTPARLRVYARRLVSRADPTGASRRHQVAHGQRAADLFPVEDAMACFTVNHTLETLAVIDDQLDTWARHRLGLDPTTSLSAHKADAAACLLLARHPLTGQPLIPGMPDHQPVGSQPVPGSTTDPRNKPIPARAAGAAADAAARSVGAVGDAEDGEAEREAKPRDAGPRVAGPLAAAPEKAAPGEAVGDWVGLGLSTVPDPAGFLPAATELRVTISADMLLGVTPEGSCDLDGFGPLTLDQARQLALRSASTMLRRVFTDPADNSVLFLDPHRYRFTTAQADTIRALHPLSTFPGSTRAASGCDLDHVIEYPTDRGDPPGYTVVSNAQPLHRSGHRLKTHGDWHVEADPDDPHTLQWTSPYRRHYTVNDHDGA